MMNQSIMSSMSTSTMADGRTTFDTGKINQLFDKIGKWLNFSSTNSNLSILLFVERANNLEIEERSIKNLAQKL